MTNTNNSTNLFEVAVREQYRFHYKGVQTVEDLWQMGLQDLDSLFKILSKQLKELAEESLLDTPQKANQELSNKVDIIKYIVKTKNEESLKLQEKQNKRVQCNKILQLLANKQQQTMENKTEEELLEMLEKLDEE